MSNHQIHLRRINRLRLLGIILILIGGTIAIMTIENLLVSSLLAFVIAYLLGPAVNRLERAGMSRVLATVAVFAAAGLVLGLLGVWISPHIADSLAGIHEEAPKYITGSGKLIDDIKTRLTEFLGPMSKSVNVTQYVESALTTSTQNFFDQLPRLLKQFVTVMLLGPFIAFFMVKDGRAIMRQFLEIMPNNLFEAALSLAHQVNQQIGSFVRARLLEALIIGVVTWIGLIIIRFPFALVLGIFAGLTNLIPYIGPIIGFVPALVIALVNGWPPIELLVLLMVYLVGQVIDIVFLIPVLVAKIVDLHPVTVIIVIIAGSQLMGILGMIISIPVTATLKVTIGAIYRHVTESRV